MRIIISLLILLLSSIFLNCNNNSKKDHFNELEKIVDNWNNKKIQYPDSLILYTSKKKTVINFNAYLKHEVKIISIINNQCTNCTISQLMYWDGFRKEYTDKFNIQIILIYSGKNEYFCKVLMEDTGIQIPVFLDESEHFIQKNDLFNNPQFQTLLLDSENKIILTGDISNNMKLEELFVNEIEINLQSRNKE